VSGRVGANATRRRRPETFDKAYFDKWYRDPGHRVRTAAERARQVRFVVAAAEQFLERPIASVLDVGAGEGHWEPVLRSMRPRIRYTGVDPSEHAVRRFGARRGIRLGTIETLDDLALPMGFDLVLCVGMLYYLTPGQFRRGVRALHGHCGGMAYLELFAAEDELEGDLPEGTARPAAWYRREMTRAGWVSMGMHCWIRAQDRPHAAALELAER
jgi:SAM-dependent methyltransferase